MRSILFTLLLLWSSVLDAAMYAKAAGGNWSAAGTWSATSAAGVDSVGPPLATTDVIFELLSGAVTVNATSVCRSLDCTSGTGSYTGALTHGAFNLSIGDSVTGAGNVGLKFASGMTYTPNASAGLIFVSTVGTIQSIMTAGKTIPGVTFNGAGGSWKLSDDMTVGAARILTLTAGTFDDGNKNVSAGFFASNNANTRSLLMGSGQWSLVANGNTIWNTDNATGLSVTRGANPVQLTYSGATSTRTINHGGTAGSESNAVDFAITAGTDIVAITTSRSVRNLDFTGFAGSWNNNTATIYGSLTVSSGMTVTGGANIITLSSTSGTKTVTTNGKTLDFPVTFSGAGGTWQLGGNLTLGSTRNLAVSVGTLTAVNGSNNYVLSSGSIGVGASGIITLGSATHTLTGTGAAVWNFNAAGTVTGTGTLKLTDTSNSTITFVGGGKTYSNVWFSRGASTAANTVTGSNTFSDFKSDGTAAHSFLFAAGSNNTATTWHVTGNGAGNEITLNSTSTAAYTLTKAGGGTVANDYLNVQHCLARPWSGTGGADTWYAGTHSVNNQATATAGSGFIFSAVPTVNKGGFFISF